MWPFFHYPALMAYLAATPTAVSSFLAYIFEPVPVSRRTRSAIRSRLRPAFMPDKARSLRVARCPVRFRNAPSVSSPPLPSRTSQSFGIVALGLAPAGKLAITGCPICLRSPLRLR